MGCDYELYTPISERAAPDVRGLSEYVFHPAGRWAGILINPQPTLSNPNWKRLGAACFRWTGNAPHAVACTHGPGAIHGDFRRTFWQDNSSYGVNAPTLFIPASMRRKNGERKIAYGFQITPKRICRPVYKHRLAAVNVLGQRPIRKKSPGGIRLMDVKIDYQAGFGGRWRRVHQLSLLSLFRDSTGASAMGICRLGRFGLGTGLFGGPYGRFVRLCWNIGVPTFPELSYPNALSPERYCGEFARFLQTSTV